MIPIKATLLRNLNKICNEHYLELESYITPKLSKLSKRQFDFISKNLERILTSNPQGLDKVNKDYIAFCTAHGVGKIKNIKRGLSRVFNYKRFTNKNATDYCGYDLAKKLNVKTCPYCNRNYTVTVAEGISRTVRPDFDHFFPKSQYPLLALSFYNLIPSCLICNRTIKNQAKIVYGKYIHPYEEGFGAALKINFFPEDVDSSLGLKTNYTILTMPNPLEPIKSEKCEDSFYLFKLKEIYKESHSGEIADIIRKHYVSNGKYLEVLKNAFPALGTIDELYRIGFGGYYSEDDFDKRPLSKLTKDVVEQLVFTYPGLSVSNNYLR